MVRYREIQPSPGLRRFVNRYWLLEHDGADALPQRIVPDGHSEIILNQHEPFQALAGSGWQKQPQCFFAGQIDGPLMLKSGGPARMLGIGFHAHGAARILPQPMHELSRRFTPLGELSSALARGLQRVFETPDPIAAVENVLLTAEESSRRADLIVTGAVRRIELARGTVDIAALARDLNLSTRQFERRFTSVVGLPPKVFCRIQRFSRVFALLDQPARNWVETALDCGYHDQAHLIRDCRSLSGSTPAVLLGNDADLARHFYQRFRVSHSYNTATAFSV